MKCAAAATDGNPINPRAGRRPLNKLTMSDERTGCAGNRALTADPRRSIAEIAGAVSASDIFDNREYKRPANPSINNMGRDIYKQRDQ